jgi:hypothetical protein
MLVSTTYEKESEIIGFLRQFDTAISKMPWKMVSPVEANIKYHLNHVFDNYIDINSMTDKEFVDFMRLINTHKISNQAKNMIVARLLFDLDELNTYRSERLRTSILENHILKLMR